MGVSGFISLQSKSNAKWKQKTSFRLARDDYFVAVHIKAQSPAVNEKLIQPMAINLD